ASDRNQELAMTKQQHRRVRFNFQRFVEERLALLPAAEIITFERRKNCIRLAPCWIDAGSPLCGFPTVFNQAPPIGARQPRPLTLRGSERSPCAGEFRRFPYDALQRRRSGLIAQQRASPHELPRFEIRICERRRELWSAHTLNFPQRDGERARDFLRN